MRKGFTLIELIIVIIIVGILGSIAFTQYTKTIEKSRGAEAKAILGTLRSTDAAYYFEYATFGDVPNLAVGAQTACTEGTHYFTYACTTGTAGGTCTATRCTSNGKSPAFTTAYTKSLTQAGVWDGTPGY